MEIITTNMKPAEFLFEKYNYRIESIPKYGWWKDIIISKQRLNTAIFLNTHFHCTEKNYTANTFVVSLEISSKMILHVNKSDCWKGHC